MTPKQKHNNIIGARTVEVLKKRGFDAYYCDNKAQALDKALELIPEGATVTWGGSASIAETGLTGILNDGNYNVLDRTTATTEAEKKEMYRKAFFSDWYLGSANAVSLSGEVINIDGTGNRVAAMIYGPDNVLLMVGINKLALNAEDAMKRARNVASPINAAKFEMDTPCAKTGICVDCISAGCICNYITVTRRCKPAGRIKVIIVGEELGF